MDKMTDIWKTYFASVIWLLASLCNILTTFSETYWLLWIKWSCYESVSGYDYVFRLCVWIIIKHKAIFQELTFLSTARAQKHPIYDYPKDNASYPQKSAPLFQVPTELHGSTRTVVKACIDFIFSHLLIYSAAF